MQNVIEVKIKASDVKNSNYCSNTDCPLARALKRMFPNDEISVGGSFVRVNEIIKYDIHSSWLPSKVSELKKLAKNKKKVDFTVILTNILTNEN